FDKEKAADLARFGRSVELGFGVAETEGIGSDKPCSEAAMVLRFEFRLHSPEHFGAKARDLQATLLDDGKDRGLDSPNRPDGATGCWRAVRRRKSQRHHARAAESPNPVGFSARP